MGEQMKRWERERERIEATRRNMKVVLNKLGVKSGNSSTTFPSTFSWISPKGILSLEDAVGEPRLSNMLQCRLVWLQCRR